MDSESQPHPLSILVWGMKSAVTAGEDLRVIVGIKCRCGCNLAWRQLAIHDDRGDLVKEVIVPDDIWPGSDAIYFVEVTMPGPMLEGRSTWEVRAISSQEKIAHSSEPAGFAIRTAAPGECTVAVKAVGSVGNTPLEAATVCMHPFRTLSDETGLAKLRVPKGEYRLLVSARGHAAVSRRVKITSHYSTCVRLSRVKSQNPYSDWDDTLRGHAPGTEPINREHPR